MLTKNHTSGNAVALAGVTVRPATIDDVEGATALLNTCSMAMIGAPEYTVEDLRVTWANLRFDMSRSTRLAVAPDGALIGYTAVWDLAPTPVHVFAYGRTHPDWEGQGIGSFLLHWAEERARQAIARVPPDVRVSLHALAPSAYARSRDLLLDHGMSVARHFRRMVIALDRPPVPRWPAGITVRTWPEFPDTRVIFRAETEIFRDIWGWVDQPEEEQFARWNDMWQRWSHRSDPAMRFFACAGDDIVGMTVCTSAGPDDPEMGYITNVGVQRGWRRQGIALALLQHGFGAYLRQGYRRVALEVDSDSLTNATRLYEKAGMSVARQSDLYEKELRPGKELSTQALGAES